MRYISRRAAFLIVVLSIAGLVLVYPPVRLLNLLVPQLGTPAWLILLFFVLPIGLRVLHEQTHQAWTRVVTAIVMTWLGICFVMLTILLPAEVILLSGLVSTTIVGVWVASIVALISAYSIFNAQRLHVREVPLDAPTALAGQSLVQISDVHIGSRQPGFLKPIVARINSLNPDYTLITGDLIDMHGIGIENLLPLGEIDSPTLFCIGNHERYVDLEDICARLAELGIEVLRNTTIQKNDFQFIGIDDAEDKTQVSRELAKLTPAKDAYKVLLYHRPDDAEGAADWGADLMLTGHTHRGQIFPFNFLVKKVFPRLYQDYQIDNMRLYVSPGTGTWGPVMRLGSRCEVTHFKFESVTAH